MSRPEPEVIVNYVDGCAYVKGKMEEAFRPGGILAEKQQAKAPKDASNQAKREDIDLIVQELEITRAQAEKALIEHKGNVMEALKSIINP